MEPRRYTMVEYSTLEIPGVALTWRDDRVLRRLLAGDEGKQLSVRQLPGRVEVRSSYWVGVARFEQFEVHVQPKLVGSEHVLIEMIAFATDAYDLRRFDALRTYHTAEDASLLELFAIMLADDCERLLREGLLADYVEREDLIPAVRGRILADHQVLKRFGVVDRVYCRFDEREQNIAENQLLLLALELAYRLVTRPLIRMRLRRLVRSFQEVCDLDGFDRDAARALHFHRLNEHYRSSHGLAWIVIDAAGLESFYQAGETHGFSFFINMNALFEKFIERLAKYIFPHEQYAVRTQFRDGSIIRHADASNTYREIRPDVLLRRRANNRSLPIDAKYKLYNDKKVATADVYQLFFYANAYNLRDDPSALLLFPKTNGHSVEHLSVHDAAGRKMGNLVACGVDVEAVLEATACSKELDGLRDAFSIADPLVAPRRLAVPTRVSVDELLANSLPEEELVIRACLAQDLPLPLLGFELSVDGTIRAEFSVAWPILQLGVPLGDGLADDASEHGWTICAFGHVLDALRERHKNRV